MRKYSGTGEARSTKGSRHPESIGSGREVPGSGSGSQGEKADAEGSNSATPSGVRENSGTEQRKTDPTTKTSLPTANRPSGSDDKKPSGVRSHGGLTAPNSVK